MAAWLRNHARQLAVKMTAQKHAEPANPGVAYAHLLHLASALMSALLVFVVACGATRVVPARFFAHVRCDIVHKHLPTRVVPARFFAATKSP